MVSTREFTKYDGFIKEVAADAWTTSGITGTPTIDINTDIVYFYAKTYIPNRLVPGNTGVQNGVYYFYAVSITTLQDVPGFPILVDGSQYDNDPRRYFIGGTTLQRPSLLQLGNTIYGSFGGICDLYNYTGSTIGIDVAQKKIVSVWGSQVGPQSAFSTDYTGDGGGGGIWQSGAGLATDGNRIFFVTGNGQGHENNAVPAPGSSGCKTLGESAVNLVPDPDTGKLTTFDYFQVSTTAGRSVPSLLTACSRMTTSIWTVVIRTSAQVASVYWIRLSLMAPVSLVWH